MTDVVAETSEGPGTPSSLDVTTISEVASPIQAHAILSPTITVQGQRVTEEVIPITTLPLLAQIKTDIEHAMQYLEHTHSLLLKK